MYAFAERATLENRVEPAPKIDEMAEFTVLLPGWQAQALEQAAHDEGVSAAQFLRRLLSQALLHRPISGHP